MKQLKPTHILTLMLVPAVVVLAMSGAFAGQAMPWDGPLNNIQATLSGPTAKAISIIAIVIAGAALVFGEDLGQFARRLLLVVLAIALIVSAAQFLSAVGYTPTTAALI